MGVGEGNGSCLSLPVQTHGVQEGFELHEVEAWLRDNRITLLCIMSGAK